MAGSPRHRADPYHTLCARRVAKAAQLASGWHLTSGTKMRTEEQPPSLSCLKQSLQAPGAGGGAWDAA